MAKSRRKKQSLFYESLALAPRLPQAAKKAAAPITQRTHEVAQTETWKNLREDVLAVGADIGKAVRHYWRLVTTKEARRIYAMALVTATATGALVVANITLATFIKFEPDLANPAVLMNEKSTGTTITDKNGVVLFQGYGAVNRHNIPFDEMPQSLKQATIAAEDPDFYKNDGFSWRGTARAAFQDLAHKGAVQGGSTITQQLVKNTLLDNEKSLTRKYKEVLLSVALSHRYSKDQILQMYLNTIYYGEGAYGIESASETYFHKQAKDLTLEESALLAGLPQSPSYYDPNANPQAAAVRREYVLKRMHDLGYINDATFAEAKAEPIQAGTRQLTIKAPHFVFYVLDQLRQQYGEDMIEHGGLTVKTTLDYDKQQKAEQMVANQVSNLSSHHVTNGGLVSIDPHTGAIISMVGSIGYGTPGYGAVNVTLAQLQPGSSFKPIAYVTAFEKGWNGATVVQDKPLSIPQPDGTIYKPQNYDQKFRGPVTLRRALQNSLNIPALEVVQQATVESTVATAHNLGIQPPSLTDMSRIGISLVLGGAEVRPIDMATVYATFDNQGKTVTPVSITSVNDKFGKDITKPVNHESKQALDPRYAYMITNILSDNRARTEEFGANSPLKLSRPAAAKTGTTNDFRDNWTVGYTPDLVTAVWVGNNDHSPMYNVDGITGAAPIWHDYMEMALAGTPAHDFSVPPGIVFARVCAADGGLTADSDPTGYPEVFLAGQVTTKKCGWMAPQKPQEDKKPDQPANPQQPPATEAQTNPPANNTQPGQGSGGGTSGGGSGSSNPPSDPNNPPSGGGTTPTTQ